MRDAVVVFASNMFIFATAVCLCLVVVREKLRRPLWQALAAGLAYAAVYCALGALLQATACPWGHILLPVFLAGAFLLYRALVNLPAGKLLSVLMMTVSLCCFAVGLGCAMKISATDSVVLLYNLVVVVLLLPVLYYVLRGVLWPLVRDLEGGEWRVLWLVPLGFSVLLQVLGPALGGTPMWAHVAVLFLCAVVAFATYCILLLVLRRAVEVTREAERNNAAEAYRALQGEQYGRIAESIAATRAARHDLRHQLLVLRGHLAGNNTRAALSFCDEMAESIPTLDERRVCANFAVNAVALHYLAMGRQAGIAMELELGIPEQLGRMQDRDMCILVGNLLENAVEACRRMKAGQRVIRMSTRTHHSSLFITMTNSFEGDLREKDGIFYSTKRAGEGMGLSSVRAVAKKYKGDVDYSATPGMFRSVAYVHLGAP